MRINDQIMKSISEKYGWCSSWAVWAEEGERPKSNIGDLTIFDFETHPDNRKILHADYIAVGLNISGGSVFPTFSNFHSSSPGGQDYKLRYAFRGTPMWGCYLTDILKNFPEVSSSKVAKFIKENPSALQPHFDTFKEEIKLLGSEDPVFLGLGGLATQLIRKALPYDTKIIQLRHYSDYISKEKYRDEVLDILGLRGIDAEQGA